MILMISRGRLTPIDETKFEAKRPRQDPYSHGCRCQTTKNKAFDPTRPQARGPANMHMFRVASWRSLHCMDHDVLSKQALAARIHGTMSYRGLPIYGAPIEFILNEAVMQLAHQHD